MNKRPLGSPTPAQKAGEIRALEETAGRILPAFPFRSRGLSRRTIDALVACGMDIPERLLFATEIELREIPGIGKASLHEIMSYRDRCIPEGGQMNQRRRTQAEKDAAIAAAGHQIEAMDSVLRERAVKILLELASSTEGEAIVRKLLKAAAADKVDALEKLRAIIDEAILERRK
jgi:hypothetical protein